MAGSRRTQTFHALVLGECGVGKSSLFMRFRNDSFTPDLPSPTFMIDSCTRTLTTKNTNVHVIMWDTAGTERYHSLTRSYYHKAHLCLFVYSTTDGATLYNLQYWLREANLYAPSAVKILVGNKTDLSSCPVDFGEEDFAIQFDCARIFKVSAKTGDELETLYNGMAQELLNVSNSNSQSLTNLLDGEVSGSRYIRESSGCAC